MRIIVTGRLAGKTTKLIKLSAEHDLYIVCQSKHEAARIFEMAQKMEIHINFPLTYQELIERRYYGKGIKGFVIDNAEFLLQSLTEVPIEAISMTGGAEDGR